MWRFRTWQLYAITGVAVWGVAVWAASSRMSGRTTIILAGRPGMIVAPQSASGTRRGNVPASLIDGQHLDSNDPKKISIATMHRAKGLEFDQVIVLAEPLAPLDGNWMAQTQRRLLYVAVTRAKRRTSIEWLP